MKVINPFEMIDDCLMSRLQVWSSINGMCRLWRRHVAPTAEIPAENIHPCQFQCSLPCQVTLHGWVHIIESSIGDVKRRSIFTHRIFPGLTWGYEWQTGNCWKFVLRKVVYLNGRKIRGKCIQGNLRNVREFINKNRFECCLLLNFREYSIIYLVIVYL